MMQNIILSFGLQHRRDVACRVSTIPQPQGQERAVMNVGTIMNVEDVINVVTMFAPSSGLSSLGGVPPPGVETNSEEFL
jgi:hypothetical protein